ncbi:ABC transporter ATP-binding protein [Candidatus Woesearchaeota archaeon]|jgi:putative ABC transport system ATP-binding protein|nr:ABC transporter ATP-binding protein [Candidatus Woesearchaeota archaeon]MBT5396761.1 ABC transporter ATP-binding protein [Candidatus Woesearchaeota archaeon]MBT5924721.1 ABC transporter ATP-binding protein [Candidatus Woesearchaeota archaeon]MBT6367649.1 ABC transporter ATP-binding protein [Candidatus Woesearchaeota archaeon]MBT7762950.1 ABC transporter ATP-binding protein [Candidatus Woesearchaeota archaeon]
MKPLIELKDVWKTYYLGENVLDVLKGVNVTIDKGEFVVIIGPSGSGKSTLMNQVGVLDIPTSGTIFLEDKDISTLEESELAQLRGKKIGFVFQQFNLIPTLTALENVILPSIFQNTPEVVRLKRAKSLLTKVGLGDRMDHKPTELSGGQQQRVAIARALINDPDIILADEPTGNLDSKAGEQVMEMLAELHTKEKKTIILVTHDTNLVGYSEKTIRIKDGLIVSISGGRSSHKNGKK